MLNALLAAGGGGLLDDLGINLKVLATQVVIFVITFLVLGRLLFGRVLENMKRREEEASRMKEALERERENVERLAKEYEAILAKADREAYEKMQTALREAMAAAAAHTAKAHEEARERVRQAREEIAREKQAAVGNLRKEAAQLAVSVAEKVLEAPLDPAVHGPVAEKYVSEGN